jgi:hypothetical protein
MEYENTFVREVKEKNMTKPEDILNWYRNLYHTEDNHTEHGIMAYAINDYFADVAPKSEVVVASVILEISKMLKSSYNRKHAFVNDEFLRGRDGAYQEFIDILTEISRKNAEGEK